MHNERIKMVGWKLYAAYFCNIRQTMIMGKNDYIFILRLFSNVLIEA